MCDRGVDLGGRGDGCKFEAVADGNFNTAPTFRAVGLSPGLAATISRQRLPEPSASRAMPSSVSPAPTVHRFKRVGFETERLGVRTLARRVVGSGVGRGASIEAGSGSPIMTSGVVLARATSRVPDARVSELACAAAVEALPPFAWTGAGASDEPMTTTSINKPTVPAKMNNRIGAVMVRIASLPRTYQQMLATSRHPYLRSLAALLSSDKGAAPNSGC